MECPNCYTVETTGVGYNQTSKRLYLEMKSVGRYDGFEYFQCPRCAKLRKSRSGSGYPGMFEDVSSEEASRISKEISSAGSGLGALLLIGLVAMIVGDGK
jgi:hypothetical protein